MSQDVSLNCYKFLIILATLHVVDSYVQELHLHDRVTEDGNVYIIRSPVPDSRILDLTNVVRFCYRGIWMSYGGVNYSEYSYEYRGIGSEFTCRNTTFTLKSFRFGGSNQTENDAVSLYGSYNFFGEELLIEQSGFGGITTQIHSAIVTGKSSWTLYEGNFGGNRICITPSSKGYALFPYLYDEQGLRTVGSLLKGCS